MAEQYILLTGGHTGLGLGVTKRVLKPGNKIGLIIRNESRKDQTLSEFAEFSQELVDNIDFFYADLSDQKQVKAAAEEISAKWPRVDRLFNNAGIVAGGRKTSLSGNELNLEINTLSHVLFVQELKPLLLASADAKVITTGTDGMSSRKLRTDKIFDENNKSTMGLYMHAKQASMFLFNDMANSMEGVKFLTVNPGPNKTKMTQGGETPGIIKYFFSLFFNDPEVGSQKIYNAGFDPRFAAENKALIHNDKVTPIKYSITEQDKQALLACIHV